jgi:hypothetical protein
MEEELRKEIKQLTELVTQVRIDIATLKVKSNMWGAISGAIAGIAAAVGSLFLHK